MKSHQPNEPAPSIHRLSVRRTARYCTMGGTSDVRSVWFVLHGYRQLAERFVQRFAEIAAPDRLIVAPEALNHFYLDDAGPHTPASGPHGAGSKVGATWMTRHDREHEIADYVAYLDALDRALGLPRDVRRIALGFSQGGAAAGRWAMLGRRRIDRLVLWGSLLPIDPPASEHARRLRRVRPVIVRSEQDPSLPVEKVDAEIARLAELRVEATPQRHGGGHTIGRDALNALATEIDPRPAGTPAG